VTRPPRRILFVCLGNICRSPTAQALLRHELARRGLADRFEVRSAGIIARGDDVATIEAVRVAAQNGVDMRDHLSTPLTAELLEQSDLVVAMDRMNLEHILNLVPDLGPRLRLLMSYADRDESLGHEVEDPIGQPMEVYELSYRQIEAGVLGLIDELVGEDSGGTPAPGGRPRRAPEGA
jgi:protein-tyrosine-phosphatase